MQEYEPRRVHDPHRSEPAGLGEIIDVGIRMFRLGLGGLLCLTGFFLSIQVFFAVFAFVTEPVELQEVLAIWDSPDTEAEAVTPPAQVTPPSPEGPAVGVPTIETQTSEAEINAPPPTEATGVLPTINAILDDLQNGRLARPIGGFVLFMMLTVLVQIALGMIKVGAAILRSPKVSPDTP